MEALKTLFEAITQQLSKARRVVSAGKTFAAASAFVLDPVLRSYLREGEELGGMEMVQIALVRWIDTDQNTLEDLETRHNDALRELKQLRIQRDDEEKALTAELTEVRSTFEFAFGRGTAETYLGLEPGFSAASNDVLRRLGHDTIRALMKPNFKTPATKVEGIWKDPKGYADRIRGVLTPFEAKLAEIRSQEKIAETTLREKTELLAKLPDRLKWSTRALEAFFHLSGLGFHADRLRTPVGSRAAPEPFEGPIDTTGEPDGADGVSAIPDSPIPDSPGDGAAPPAPSTEEPDSSDPSV